MPDDFAPMCIYTDLSLLPGDGSSHLVPDPDWPGRFFTVSRWTELAAEVQVALQTLGPATAISARPGHALWVVGREPTWDDFRRARD